MEEVLLTHPTPQIALITLNRPHAMNALSISATEQFAEKVHKLTRTPLVRVVVLTGAGEKAFCSGGDLAELRDKTRYADIQPTFDRVFETLNTLENLPIPIIGAVNGYALGGGSEIALACDMRVLDETAKLGFVQINMGLTTGWGAGQRLLRLVGYPKALELLLEGKPISAQTAYALGLANRIVPAGTATQHALEWAQSLANRPPDVVRSLKQLLRAGITRSATDSIAIERAVFAPLWEAEAHLSAVEAFFNRKESPKTQKD